MNKYYTGIGSRQCPKWAYDVVYDIAMQLAYMKYTLRSGGAEGTDTAFEKGCDHISGKKEIYLPWKGFNDNPSQLYKIDDYARSIAKEFHPFWHRLSSGAKKLHTRNVYQIVGYDWKHASRFIICYSQAGGGGTGQAIRIANHLNIKVIDLYEYDSLLWDTETHIGRNEIVRSVLGQVLIKRYRLKIKNQYY